MLIKKFDRESTVLAIAALTFFQYGFNSALAQVRGNSKKHTSKPALINPVFPSHKGRLSSEEIKAAGEQANKFYRLAEQKEKTGKLDEAKQLYYKAALSRSDIWGQSDPAVSKIVIKIGEIELKQKHPNAARIWFKQALKTLSNRYGSGDYELVPVLTLLAKLESSGEDHEAASSYYQHILLLKERKFGEENPQINPTRISYIEELLAEKDPSGAEKVAKKAIDIEKRARGPASEDLSKFEKLLTSAQAARANDSSK